MDIYVLVSGGAEFLRWYAAKLRNHGDQILEIAREVPAALDPQLSKPSNLEPKTLDSKNLQPETLDPKP